MGFEVECKTLAHMMKTNKQTTKSSISKNIIQKRSVGRPRKLKIRVEPVSDTSSKYIQMSGIKNIPNEKIQTLKPLKSNSNISKVQVCMSLKIISFNFLKIISLNCMLLFLK